MTDDTRLDSLVRGALTELPLPDDAQTRAALGNVLERSRAPRVRSRAWVAPALIAAAVALAALAGVRLVTAQEQSTPTPSAPTDALVGDWQRQVSGAEKSSWDGRWRLAIADDGVLLLSGPARTKVSSEGASYAATDAQIRIDVFVNSACPEMAAGVYGWERTGARLTLTLVEDPCEARAEMFDGTWRRAE
jgi:hypothetical protein